MMDSSLIDPSIMKKNVRTCVRRSSGDHTCTNAACGCGAGVRHVVVVLG